jgi:WD40 repeat-containing protein SMU1
VKTTTCDRTFSPETEGRADSSIINAWPVPKQDNEMILCTRSNKVYHMSHTNGQVLRTFTHGKPSGADFVQCLLSPAGKILYCLAEDQQLYAFAFDSTELLHVMRVHEREPIGLAHHPHKNLVATFSDDGLLVVWKALGLA